jgi:hypothetical protein
MPRPLLHRNFRISESCLAASFPHEEFSEAVSPFKVSCLPTSLPIAYPALKPTTETRTTTLALTTQVSSVGLTTASSTTVIFFFLVTLDGTIGFVLVAFRLPLSVFMSFPETEGLLWDLLLGLEAAGGVPVSSDSGTRRIPVNSGRATVFAPNVLFWLRLGSPLAAAAHDKSVVKLARNAASRSAW